MKRTYDKTYRTNEPLAGKPDVEWEEKDWDVSPGGSDFSGRKTPPRQRIHSDPEYATVEDSPMSRTGTIDSGIGYDKQEHRPYTMYDDYEREDDNLQKTSSSSQPILNYNSDDYAQVKKPIKNVPISTMSSKITAV